MAESPHKTPLVASTAEELFSQARRLGAARKAAEEKNPPLPMGSASAATREGRDILITDRSAQRYDRHGLVNMGVFDMAAVNPSSVEEVSGSRATTQAARVNSSSIYAASQLVNALMAYPGIKGGGTEEEDRIVDDLMSRAIQSTDKIVDAIGLTEANPRFIGHRNRIFRAQLDILAKAHTARFVHEYGADDADGIADIQVRIASKIDKTDRLSADGDMAYLDAAVDVGIAKMLAMTEVASAIIDEIGRCRFNFGVKDPLTEIAFPAATRAAEAVAKAAPHVVGENYGKNRVNDGMVETSLTSSAARIYRACFTNNARELIAHLESLDEVARAAEFDMRRESGWPTDKIHLDFDRYFNAVIGFVAGPVEHAGEADYTEQVEP